MKARKFIGALLASVMMLSAFVGLAACGNGGDDSTCKEHVDLNGDKICDNCGEFITDKNKDWKGDVYSIVGTGSGILFKNDWDAKQMDEDRIFNAGYAADGKTEVHTLEIDLFEGDVFQIILGNSFDKQIDFTSLENEGKDAQGNEVFVGSHSYNTYDIRLVEGQSGRYKLTLTVAKGSSPSISFEKKSSFTDLALLKLVDTKGEPCFSDNFLNHSWLRERAGIYFKKGDTVPTVPYTPPATATPVAMTFGGWNKEDGTKWTGGAINGDMTLKVRYDEAVDANYVADKADAAYYLVGKSTNPNSRLNGQDWKYDENLKFTRSNDYRYHNVYELKHIAMTEGDQFQIGWGDGNRSKFSWIASTGEVRVSQDDPNIAEINTFRDGVYDIRIIVTIDATSKEVKEMNISLSYVSAIPSGFYLVGTYLDPTFGSAADDPYNSLTVKFYSSGNVYSASITVTQGMFRTGTQYAEFLVKMYQPDGNGPQYGATQSGGTATSGANAPHIKLGVGEWRISFTPVMDANGNVTSATISWERQNATA